MSSCPLSRIYGALPRLVRKDEPRGCIDRKALAKACCCGDREAMASLNSCQSKSCLKQAYAKSAQDRICYERNQIQHHTVRVRDPAAFGVGIIDSSSGIVSSSLFWRMASEAFSNETV